MLTGRILQGLGIGLPVLLLTVMRLLLISAPLSWAAIYWFHGTVEWVWAAMLLGVVLTALVSAVWLRVGLRRAERGVERGAGLQVGGEAPAEAARAG
jgi:Na+-driven multidrug efflux pump